MRCWSLPGNCRCRSRNGSDYPARCESNENADIGNEIVKIDPLFHQLPLHLKSQSEVSIIVIRQPTKNPSDEQFQEQRQG